VYADAPTRLGARAQLLSALLALAANALLPFVIPDARAGGADKRDRRALRNSQIVGRVDLESVGLGLSPVDAGVGRSLAYGVGKDERGRRGWWGRVGRRVRVPDAVRVPLPTMWAASHLVFAGCMVGSL
jgi:solute carrier family 45 protein 1/2/4